MGGEGREGRGRRGEGREKKRGEGRGERGGEGERKWGPKTCKEKRQKTANRAEFYQQLYENYMKVDVSLKNG